MFKAKLLDILFFYCCFLMVMQLLMINEKHSYLEPQHKSMD